FRIPGWAAFDARKSDKVKEQLALGRPVIFALRYTAKLAALRGDTVLDEDDTPGEGHAMVAVGYDDARHGMLIRNSHGRSWGSEGYGWVSYGFWERNVRTGFVIE